MKQLIPNLMAKLLPLAVAIAATSALAATPAPSSTSVITPKDIAIANPERITYWLTKRGELSASATEAEKKAALKSYLDTAARVKPFTDKAFKSLMPKPPKGFHKKNVAIQQASSDKTNTTVKVLAVLIDFPDLRFNNNHLTSADTQMFYSNFSQDHYNQMLFGDINYPGPSGQNLKTVHQYYKQESGDSLSFTGTVLNWVTASANAATYGGNTGEDDSDANATGLVVEAVTKAIAQNNINLADYDIEDPFDIDGDGNTNEPDGFIDHLMVIHSSMGEEEGGGFLGADAIWSHRFFVNATGSLDTMGFAIPGTNIRGFGYTIEPINAAIGVLAHEFGHDLGNINGIIDEYDTANSASGSTVANWSLMAGGSWAGFIPGTSPVTFSPLARDYLQNTYGGNWINQQEIDAITLNTDGLNVDLVEATNHEGGVNQVKVNLSPVAEDFFSPFSGNFQYYSGQGDMFLHSMTINTAIPSAQSAQLTMKAHWNIEQDYDYVTVNVNGTPIPGDMTRSNNQYYPDVHNYITGISKEITGSAGDEGWVDLTFDLTGFVGQNIALSISYSTDQNTGGYGFVADDINITADNNAVFTDGAEVDNSATLDGFSRIDSTRPGATHNYYLQLRSHNGQDSGLTSINYQTGLMVWYANQAYSENNVDVHPGYGFLTVVDANQTPKKNGERNAPSSSQVSDAPFGVNPVNATALFDDSVDYTHPEQPQSGVIVPQLGLKFDVTTESANASSATVQLTGPSNEPTALAPNFSISTSSYKVFSFTNASIGGVAPISYHWDFGDGQNSTEANPTHTFSTAGNYIVVLTATDADNVVQTHSDTVTIAEELIAQIDNPQSSSAATISLNASSQGGTDVTFNWDFGDNQSASGASVSHTYSFSGTYTVTLTATSSDGQTQTQSLELHPTVVIVATINATINNLSASFSKTISGGDGNYTFGWEFGDGSSPSNEASPTHTYATPGTYTAQLQLVDGESQIKIVTMEVTVTSPPVVTPTPSSSGGGGSTGFGLLFLAALGLRRKISH